MKKFLMTVSFVCFAAGYSQAHAQVNVDIGLGRPAYVERPVHPVYVEHPYSPEYRYDHERKRNYDWRYWDEHNDHHDNGRHNGWYKHDRD